VLRSFFADDSSFRRDLLFGREGIRTAGSGGEAAGGRRVRLDYM